MRCHLCKSLLGAFHDSPYLQTEVVLTDEEGRFELRNVSEGSHALLLLKDGFTVRRVRPIQVLRRPGTLELGSLML